MGMLGDPITPLIAGAKATVSMWPVITSIAAVNYINTFVDDAAPAGGGMANNFIRAGVFAATDIFKLATWDAAKNAYPH